MTESHVVPIEKADKQSNGRLKVIGKVCLYSANIAKSMVNTHLLYPIFIDYSLFFMWNCQCVKRSFVFAALAFHSSEDAVYREKGCRPFPVQMPCVPDTNADLSIE